MKEWALWLFSESIFITGVGITAIGGPLLMLAILLCLADYVVPRLKLWKDMRQAYWEFLQRKKAEKDASQEKAA